MKIKCIKNSYFSKEKFNIEKKYSEKICDLKIGNNYIVYALGFFEDGVWYCICDDSYFYYPIWYPSMLFEIADTRLSRYWIFNINEDDVKKIPFVAFPEWAKDSYFYGELIEDNTNDPNAIVFRKYKALMDLEFPNPSISEVAEIGDRDWLICPKCIDAWEWKDEIDALVKCPKCKTIFNNPRYINELPHL